MGKNKEFLLSKLTHIDEILISNIEDFLENTDLLVIVNADDLILKSLSGRNNLKIVDFQRMKELEKRANYTGICW